MKSKLLFAAALVAAGVVGTQAVRLANSSWSLQLLENQQLGGVNPLAADEAEARDVQALSYEGEAVVSGQVYYLYNVGAGKFLEGGSDFGTFATFAEIGVPITFTSVGENLYTLNTGMGSGFLSAEGWMDQTTDKANLTLKPVDGKENVYTLGTDAAYFGYDGSAAKMSLNVTDASSDNAQWILVSKSQREEKLAQATAESGVDASFSLANPNFSRNVNPFGWTDDGSMCAHVGDDGDKLVEIFNKDNADFHQTVTGLPNGVYVVSCVGFYRNGDAGPAAESYNNDTEAINSYLYAGDNQTPLASIFEGFGKLASGGLEVTVNGEKGRIPNGPAEGVTLFTAGEYPRTEVKAIVTDGTLTFGIRKAAKTNNDWTLFDSFRLTYYGEASTDELAQELTAKAAEAKDLATDLDGLVPTAYVDELTGYAAPTCSTVEEYNAAINAVNELINKANSAKEVLAETFFPTTDYANQVLELFPNGAADALEKAIEEATAATLASTEPAVWAAQAEAVNAAVKAYYEGCDKVMDGDGVTNFNVTLLVMQNPGFEDAENPLAGWNGFTPDVSLGWAQVISTAHYQPTFDFYQDVTVPNGLYSASVQEHANIGDKTNLYLQSSNQRQEVKMNWNMQVPNREDWDEALDLNRATTGNVLVTDGKVRIGVNMHTANQNQALYFDNFRLVRVSDGLNEVKALYGALKTEVEGLDQSGLSSGVAQALNEALALPVTTASEYYAAYDALRKAMDYKGAASDLATDMEALLAACQGYLDYSTSNEEDSKALTAAMEEAEGYESLTTGEAVTAAYDKLADAARSFVTIAAPTEEQGFDVTILYLTNPDVTGMTKAAVSSFGWVSCTNSWSNNFNNNNDPSQFYESYQSGGGFAAGTWVLYQTVNLPAGNYKMTLQAFGQNANGAGSFDGDTPIGLKASVYAGDVKGDAVADGKTLDNVYSVSFAQASLKDVQLGMRADEGNGANWMGCNNMKLYKMQNEAVELNEASAYGVTSDTYADVTMTRAMSAKLDGEETAKWNTFCVPFDMTAEQLTANKITKVVQLTAAETTADNGINLTSEEVTDGVKAGVPYLVQVSEDVTEITAEGVYVTAAAPAAQTIGTAGDYTVAMTGNYSAMTVPTDAYFISGNTFYVADAEAEVALKGFRAYITLTAANGEPAAVNVRSISIDGSTAGDGTTGIEGVAGETADRMVDVYTLSGVKVKGGVKASEALDGLQRGVYIVNGKKIIK